MGNTPLKWYKQTTFGGGVRDPLIIHWPEKIKDHGGIRTQFHHVTDIVPTILELLDIDAPDQFKGIDQIPISGTSMAYTLEGADEPTRKKVQYFEMFGHRGIWADGWKAVTRHRPGTKFEDEEWELYHVDEDFSECRNLAVENPEKLRELIDLWWVEAGRHGVLPLDDRGFELFRASSRPGTPHATRHYTYYPPISHMPAEICPGMGSRTWNMDAEVDMPDPKAGGVLVARGSQNSGFSWYVKDSKLVFDYNYFTDHHVVRSVKQVPPGKNILSARFLRDGNKGTITLLINGQECGSMELTSLVRIMGSIGMDIGRDALSPVTDDYDAPFPFSGTIHKLEIDLPKYKSAKEKDEEAKVKFKTEMATQ